MTKWQVIVYGLLLMFLGGVIWLVAWNKGWDYGYKSAMVDVIANIETPEHYLMEFGKKVNKPIKKKCIPLSKKDI